MLHRKNTASRWLLGRSTRHWTWWPPTKRWKMPGWLAWSMWSSDWTKQDWPLNRRCILAIDDIRHSVLAQGLEVLQSLKWIMDHYGTQRFWLPQHCMLLSSCCSWMKELFQFADKNGDNALNLKEIVGLLQHLNIEVDLDTAKSVFEVGCCNCRIHKMWVLMLSCHSSLLKHVCVQRMSPNLEHWCNCKCITQGLS